jgi:hypothetical protein
MENCPDGFYSFDNTTLGSKVCLPCDGRCSKCTGSGFLGFC